MSIRILGGLLCSYNRNNIMFSCATIPYESIYFFPLGGGSLAFKFQQGFELIHGKERN